MEKGIQTPLVLITLLVFTISLTFQTQGHLTKNYPHNKTEDLKYLPSGNFLKGAVLTYDEIASDILWIKAIGYLGHHVISDQDYTWLHHIISIATTLDPLFEDPYEMGGIVLSNELGEIDKGISILKKGMKNVPENHSRYWKLPFFAAFNYMYYKQDYLEAARLLEKASSFSGTPEYLPLLTSRLYAQTEDPTAAIPFLQEMTKSTSNPALKEKFNNRIKQIIVTRDQKYLGEAVNFYIKKFGKSPQNLEELIKTAIIPVLPAEPFGGKYFLDINDNKVKSNKSEELILFNKGLKKQ